MYKLFGAIILTLLVMVSPVLGQSVLEITDNGEYGYIPGGDQDHPNFVEYGTGGFKCSDPNIYSDFHMTYRLFNVTTPNEVLIFVNGTLVKSDHPVNAGWAEYDLLIDRDLLYANANNYIRFRSYVNPDYAYCAPNPCIWGVSMTSITPSVVLEWDSNSEPDLDGYNLYIGTQTRNYNKSIDVGNPSGLNDGTEGANEYRWTDDDFAWNVEYFIAATAYDLSDNESDYSDEVVITFCLDDMIADNHPPVANAGDDATIWQYETHTLDGSYSSDEDGDTLDFYWNVIQEPSNATYTLVNPSGVTASFTPETPGIYVIQLVVSDGTETNSDTVTITVLDNTPIPPTGLKFN